MSKTSQHVTQRRIFGALGGDVEQPGHDEQNLTFGQRNYQYYETIWFGSPPG